MLKPIYIPDVELESDRILVRYRMRLQRDLTRCKSRIKSMLHQLGIVIPARFDNANWSNVFIQWLQALKMQQDSAKVTLNFMIDQVLRLRQKQLEVCEVFERYH